MLDHLDHAATASLDDLKNAFRSFEKRVPPPQRVAFRDGFVARFVERTPKQAILLKFARQVSGLHALSLLMRNGFCQEQGVIQRTLDDFAEDITFLSLGLTKGPWTAHHEAFLKNFWADEFFGEEQPPMVRRDKIRAYVNRAGGIEDTSSANATGKTVFKAYSGYVHGAAVNILDMCVGGDLQFNVTGMSESPLYQDHRLDFWNYLYRGVTSASFVALALCDADDQTARYQEVKEFERRFGSLVFPQASSL